MKGLLIGAASLTIISTMASADVAAAEVSGIASDLVGAWSVACAKGPSAWRHFKDGKAIGPGTSSLTVTKTGQEGNRFQVYFADGSSEKFERTDAGLRYVAQLRPDGSVAVDWASKGAPTLARCPQGNGTQVAQAVTQQASPTPVTASSSEMASVAEAQEREAKARLDDLKSEHARAMQALEQAQANEQKLRQAVESAEETYRKAQNALIIAKGGYAPGQTIKECADCPEVVVIPAGSFLMGSPSSEPDRSDGEGPQHRVTIGQPFAAGKYPVTFAEWDACVSAGGCNGYRPEDEGWRGRRPVIHVSWDDATAYVSWLSRKTGQKYRLLSEAEREYVTRAGTTTPYWTGQTISTSQANFNGNGTYNGSSKGTYRQRTVDVGSFKANAFGLYDVSGNVMDWVEDCWHDNYNGAPANGSAWTSGSCQSRVVRGGSFFHNPKSIRSAFRYGSSPGIRSDVGGFRIARTLTP